MPHSKLPLCRAPEDKDLLPLFKGLKRTLLDDITGEKKKKRICIADALKMIQIARNPFH